VRIAIVGQMQSGKDCLANSLNYLYPRIWQQTLKFADPLYDIQHAIYGVLRDYKYPITEPGRDRTLLQLIGTQWGRETISSHLWTDMFHLALVNSPEPTDGSPFITRVTDCRFPNEANLLKDCGFVFVGLQCSDEVRIKRGATNLTHESEIHIPELIKNYADVVINTELEPKYAIAELKKFLDDKHYADLH